MLTGHEAAVYALAPWRGGLLSGGGDGLLAAWSPPYTAPGRVVARIDDRIVRILPLDGAEAGQLVVGCLSGDLYWIDATQARPPRRWVLHRDGAFGLCASADHVFAVGGGGLLSRWRRADGAFDESVAVDRVRLRAVAYLPGAGVLAVGTAAGDLRFVDAHTLGTRAVRERAHDATVFSLTVLGETLFSSGRDGAIRAWATREPFGQRAHVAAHGATVNAVDGGRPGWIASAGRDREARVWRWDDDGAGQPELVLAKALTAARDGGHVHSVNACCWLGGDTLATAGDDRTIRIWLPARVDPPAT